MVVCGEPVLFILTLEFIDEQGDEMIMTYVTVDGVVVSVLMFHFKQVQMITYIIFINMCLYAALGPKE